MPKKIPMRQCLGCREMKPKPELLRVVRSPEGEISLDLKGKKPGRGAYICRSADCLRRAVKSRALSRALETQIPDEVMERLAETLEADNDGQGT
ncbi:MAG TPA: YlxR family protein [Candidatus Scatomorpha merdigallinarum]|nr:YlxR family protein [Candidatus Scatomorpha merdigallinarum]